MSSHFAKYSPCVVLAALSLFLGAPLALAEYVVDPAQCDPNPADINNPFDCTDAIQDALDSSESVIRLTNAVGFDDTWITKPLFIRSNKTIYIDAGVRVRAHTEGYNNDSAIFNITPNAVSGGRPTNIAIRGTSYLSKARIEFHPTEQNYTDPSGRGHAIFIANADNILVENVHIKYAYGDGIYIGDDNGAHPDAEKMSTNVVVQDSVIEEAVRNGISVIAGEHIRVQNVTINNTHARRGIGIGPFAGIDIETDQTEHPLTDIQINDCNFSGNGSHGILIELTSTLATQDGNTISIAINQPRVLSSEGSGIVIKNALPALKGNILVTGGSVHNTRHAAIAVHDKAKTGPYVEFSDMEIDNVNLGPGTSPDDVAPIAIYKETTAFTDGNVRLTNLTITNNTAVPNAVRVQGVGGVLVDGVDGDLTVLNGNEAVSTSQAINVNVAVY